MNTLPFATSALGSVGTELELQIIDRASFNLHSYSKNIIRDSASGPFKEQIKPEITQCMIEINSSVHQKPQQLYKELVSLQSYLDELTRGKSILFCGGGTHPFQEWDDQDIYPTNRYRHVLHHYRFFCKRATLFGQHVHIGCENGDDALYLTHALARFIPQFIAISAASPFYRSFDTGMCSTRSALFSGFPMCGIIPYLKDYQAFSDYVDKLKRLNIIDSMKDLYWDIRPKPEFGTVEVRILDTPLTLKKATTIVAFIQTLALYLLKHKPIKICRDLYYLYETNRFEAIRYGFEGTFICPETEEKKAIDQDILDTLKNIAYLGQQLGTCDFLDEIEQDVINKKNDTAKLRQWRHEGHSFEDIVEKQCQLWQGQY